MNGGTAVPREFDPKPDPDLTEALADDPTLCVTGTDHVYDTTFDDGELWQGICRACGAEGEVDLTEVGEVDLT
jgi:hypothetical protein